MLTFAERKIALVLAVERQQVERIEPRFPPMKQQIAELRNSGLVQADDFAIEHGDAQLCIPLGQGDVQRRGMI